jgi:uncharacterized protein (TIGR03084 family)
MTPPTDNVLEQVLTDLAEESAALEAMVAPLDESGWRTPTPAAGWDVATQIAHLAWTDEVAVVAATDKQGWDALVLEALEDPTGFVDVQALEGGRADPAEVLARWRAASPALRAVLRSYPTGQKMPWFGPPMSPTSMGTARFMETWAHALDVAEALGIATEPSDRIRHVAHLGVRTRDFSFGVHSLTPPDEQFRVELRSPSGELWEWGPADAAQSVRGSAYDFCLRVTQRRHRDDLDLVAVGPDADRWLDLAQAFAGPPGEGRPSSAGRAEDLA